MNPTSKEKAQVAEASLLRLLLHAYPDRVTVRNETDPSRGVMVGGRKVLLEPSSVVREGALFLSIDPRDPPGTNPAAGSEARVSLASRIESEWLGEVFPHLLQSREKHEVNPRTGRVVATRETLFADLVIETKQLHAGSERGAAEESVREHIRANASAMISVDEDAVQWLARVKFLARQMPELQLPEFDEGLIEEALLERAAEMTRKNPPILGALESKLTWKQRAALKEHAPETIPVPSGSRIRVQYTGDDRPPFIAVRVQELFGLAEGPCIAAGRVPVALHLLGPNYRPVQITSDLRNFWNTTYKEVRRELRARYPKHPWPEDPWNAPPVAVGRRRKK